jgi:hypothetical protein
MQVRSAIGQDSRGFRVWRRGCAPAFEVVLALAAASAGCSSDTAPRGATGPLTAPMASLSGQGNVAVNMASRQQVITGWEATAQAGQGTAAYPKYRDALMTLAAGDLGINRLRVAVRSGAENPVDSWMQMKKGLLSPANYACLSYTSVNDDSNPLHINPAGFHFTELDSTVEQVVLPLRAKLAALGRTLYLNVNYTAMTGGCGAVDGLHTNPQEYAEFALATFQHLQQKYALVPDSWEMILEPDKGGTPFNGDGELIGRALVATSSRLAAAGFHPQLIAPSTMQAANAPRIYGAIQTVSGAPGLVTELSYHRYGTVPSATTLASIAQTIQSDGIRSSMLEHIGADYNELIADLLQAHVSAWQQYTLAFTGSDNGGKYYVVNTSNPSAPTVKLGNRTRYLRQFFHYVLAGAYRVDASTTQPVLTPVAFQNPNGKAVLVVRATAAAAMSVQGLPAGTYGLRYTTAGATDAAAGSDQTIAGGQLVNTTIPAAGVITIFEK